MAAKSGGSSKPLIDKVVVRKGAKTVIADSIQNLLLGISAFLHA